MRSIERDGVFERIAPWSRPAPLRVSLMKLALHRTPSRRRARGAAAARCRGAVRLRPNEGSGTLSVIDTATDQVVADIAVGRSRAAPRSLADGRTAYVSDQPNNAIVPRRPRGAQALGIDRRRRLARGRRHLGGRPLGRRCGRGDQRDRLHRHADERQVVRRQGARQESRARGVLPDGRYVFVSAEDGQAVDIIEVAARPGRARCRSARGPAASSSRPTAGAPTSPPKRRTRST